MKVLISSLFVLIQISLNYGAFPLILHKCSTLDSACLKARAQILIPSLAAGIPQIGTERLDPMLIDYINIEHDGFSLIIYNAFIKGLDNAVIDNVSLDMKNRIIRLLYHADFSIKSQYSAQGFLFFFPIFGIGEFSLNHYNVVIEIITYFDIIKNEHGKYVISLKSYSYEYDVRGGGQYFFKNLYYGDQGASGKMHALLNQNWKYLSILHGRKIYDKVNDYIFDTIRTHLLSQPLENLN